MHLLVFRNCYWCPAATEGVPWCYAPPELGYSMVGEPEVTPKGYRVNIRRKEFNTWFTKDIWDATVDVEFQENERLRVKVSGLRDTLVYLIVLSD